MQLSVTRATTAAAKSILSLNPDNVKNCDNVVYDNTALPDFQDDMSWLDTDHPLQTCDVQPIAQVYRDHFKASDDDDSWPKPGPSFHYRLKNTYKWHKGHCHHHHCRLHPSTGKSSGFVIAATLIFCHRDQIPDYRSIINSIQSKLAFDMRVIEAKKESVLKQTLLKKAQRDSDVLSKNLKYL